MTYTYITVISHRAWDAECLKTNTDSLSCVCSVLAALLDSDGCAYHVSPLCIFKADTLSLFASHVWIETCLFADFVSLFDRGNAVLLESSKYLLHAAVL